MTFEFRSKIVQVDDHSNWNTQPDKIEQTCNKWAEEGFEVFSVICPQPSNWNTYRLTAKRIVSGSKATGRKFRV